MQGRREKMNQDHGVEILVNGMRETGLRSKFRVAQQKGREVSFRILFNELNGKHARLGKP